LFQTCPLRYFFKYLERLPEETVSASLVFGSALHRAIEHHFGQLADGRTAPGRDELRDVFWDAWYGHGLMPIQFGRGDNVQTMGALADRLLDLFRTSALAQPGGTIIGIEKELRGQLLPGLPVMVARIDLLVETDDALVLRDFKTARSAWNDDSVADAADQLLLYSELVRPLAGAKPLRLSFLVLTKTKLPTLTEHAVPLEPGQVERSKRIVAAVWRAIQRGHYYPNPSPLNCHACPYRQACRAWKG
jgi:putative RecB family exonuclease